MFKAGDRVNVEVNGELIPAVIVSSTAANGCELHSVRLEAPVQGCEAGEIVAECYSLVTPAVARRYGIARSVFARPTIKCTGRNGTYACQYVSDEPHKGMHFCVYVSRGEQIRAEWVDHYSQVHYRKAD